MGREGSTCSSTSTTWSVQKPEIQSLTFKFQSIPYLKLNFCLGYKKDHLICFTLTFYLMLTTKGLGNHLRRPIHLGNILCI